MSTESPPTTPQVNEIETPTEPTTGPPQVAANSSGTQPTTNTRRKTAPSASSTGGGATAAISKADEKYLGRLSLSTLNEAGVDKIANTEHQKRLTNLRREAKRLENTAWMYESIDKLLGR